MKQLSLCSSLNRFRTVDDFVDAFKLGKYDLLITCSYIYTPYFERYDLPCQVILQDKFGSGEPNDEMIESMLDSLSRDYNRVIAVGGGTVLDIAKIFVLKNNRPIIDLFQFKITPEKKCPLVLVPTTCGTGSEVTNVAICGINQLDTKLRIAYDELYADDAVLVPELLETLPYEVFATSSIDALIHAIESSLSPLATPYSKLFGHKAMELIIAAYKRIAAEGKGVVNDLLDDFLLAANYAGIAFGKAGCGAAHAMSYPYGGKYHVTHGEANYCLLTAVLAKYAEKECIDEFYETMAVLAGALGCDAASVPAELENLLTCILVRKPMSAFGATADDIEPFTDSCLKYQSVILSHDPVELSRDDMIDIYRKCL